MRTVNKLNSLISPLLLAASVLATLPSCAPAKWHETGSAPNTGDPVIEKQVAPTTGSLQPGSTGYISANRLRGFDNVNQPGEETNQGLERNDEVEVVDANPQGPEQLVKVKVKNTQSPAVPPGPIYISKKYISDKQIQSTPEQANADRYLVIENIATEKLRVYERCKAGPGCANKLILETDMVVGQNTPALRSEVGSYRIQAWEKFYEDSQRLYPSWMTSGAPVLPGPGAPLAAWTSVTLLPSDAPPTAARAAFGWFTAKIGPNASEQWTHGTWGYGVDGDKFIQAVRNSSDSRIGSHGCSRVENQVIALMHEILPAGTQLVKVYAKETLRGSEVKAAAPTAWDWILTSDAQQKKMSASLVQASGVKILDRGRFVPTTQAHAASGNVYAIPDTEFQGEFLVDEGRLTGYAHPKSLGRGGYNDKNILPASAKGLSKSQPRLSMKQRIETGKHAPRVPDVIVQK